MARRMLLGLAVAGLMAGTVTGTEAQSLRLGVFDAQKIFSETAEGAKIQAELNALEANKRAELEAVQQELRGMQQELVATAASVSNEKLRDLRLKIDRKTIELESLQKSATREFQLAVEQAQQDWQDRIVAIVQDYGQKNGYTLIIPIGVVAYHAGATDITAELIKIVDAQPGQGSGSGS